MGACSSGLEEADAAEPAAAPSDTGSASAAQDVKEIEYFAPLEPGAYSIDPDLDPSTPLRVEYDISAEGWSRWIGAWKVSDDGHVGVSITTVTNLVRHGCRNHSWADPPVGQSVNMSGPETDIALSLR